MSPLDRKLIKLIGCDEYMLEYLPFISDEQKLKHIKIARGKLREINRREARICNFLNTRIW